jgi:hypothetical protein
MHEDQRLKKRITNALLPLLKSQSVLRAEKMKTGEGNIIKE